MRNHYQGSQNNPKARNGGGLANLKGGIADVEGKFVGSLQKGGEFPSSRGAGRFENEGGGPKRPAYRKESYSLGGEEFVLG